MITAEEARNIPINTNINDYINTIDETIPTIARLGFTDTNIAIPEQISYDFIQIMKANGYSVAKYTYDNVTTITISWKEEEQEQEEEQE